MSGLAARVDRPVAPPPATAAANQSKLTAAQTEFLLRMAAFLALAAFAVGHWWSVVQHAPAGRAALLLLVCAAGGTGLWFVGTLNLPAWLTRVVAALIVVAMAVLALLATGLRFRYLHHWGALGHGLNHGLLDAQAAVYPYQGTDGWVRLTLLLAGPLFLVPATALAFWPARRYGSVLRAIALVTLIVLYGLALAERSPAGQIGRGVALLVLIAAWLWLPRLSVRDAGPAAAVLAGAAILALPVAVQLGNSHGWIDYRNWHVVGNTAGIDYSWNHSYGPIHWPRRGTTLLYMRADRPYYWKAETLNDFNGVDWLRSTAATGVSSSSELPPSPNPKWMKQIQVTVAALRGNLVIGAGTPQVVSGGAGDAELAADGTVVGVEHSLRNGENYTVKTYIPEPTAAQLRHGPQGYEQYYGVYTLMDLPVHLGGIGHGGFARVDPGLWGSGGGDPLAPTLMEHSVYAGMYKIVRRLAAGQTTAYGVVRKVERYLNTSRFAYDEHPPVRKYPLESFLIKDRVGYCQQFSGAMALMLRMVGIPARVATGFAPGTPQPGSDGVYRVRDLDAHSWVEVYFPDVGWVTFDPTPAVSPASSQSEDTTALQGGVGPTPRGLGQTEAADPKGGAATIDIGPPHHSAFKWWMVPAGLVVLTLLVLAALRMRRNADRRRALPPDDRALGDLCAAMARLGNPVTQGATLTSVERTLERRGGPEAARYARLIRDYRYGANGAVLPGPRERRALRRALAPTAGRLGRLKVLRALPPVHF